MSVADYSNTAGFSSAGLHALHERSIGIIAEHGIDPCTYEQAAAHEAGHIVVGKVMGEKILGARLVRQRCNGLSQWVGQNSRWHADNELSAVATCDTPTPRLFRAVANNLAGYLGEIAAGHGHPSSSIDERMKAECFCMVLANRLGMHSEECLSKMHAFCDLAIDSNRRQFDVVRAHLVRTRRLTRKHADSMLHGVVVRAT